MGCDLAYVFCTPSAAPVIKGYSPELIVMPDLIDGETAKKVRECMSITSQLLAGCMQCSGDVLVVVYSRVVLQLVLAISFVHSALLTLFAAAAAAAAVGA
jgi:hypothetical protein